MKRNIKYYTLAFGSILLLSVVSSCVKSRAGRTDFDSLKPTVLIPEGGLQTFATQALVFPGTDDVDTAWFHINYAATNVAPQDETVTIAIDADALAAYNARGGAQYTMFPDSIYSFKTTSVTVKKGDNYSDAIAMVLFPSKVDGTKNYMLPITIKTAPAGSTISTNFQTIYYHLIGNPIAGAYAGEFIRYLSATQTGTPNDDDNYTALFSPEDATTVAIQDDLGFTFHLSFTNTGGVLSNFKVAFDPDEVKALGVAVGSGPTVVSADPVAGTYELNYIYLNGSGLPRNCTDKFHK